MNRHYESYDTGILFHPYYEYRIKDVNNLCQMLFIGIYGKIWTMILINEFSFYKVSKILLFPQFSHWIYDVMV